LEAPSSLFSSVEKSVAFATIFGRSAQSAAGGVAGGVPERPKGADCKSAGFAYGGSNPPAPTHTEYAPVAQSVEHFHGKEGVSGSSPLGGSGIGVYSIYDIGVAV
jgi:hypothetical protein